MVKGKGESFCLFVLQVIQVLTLVCSKKLTINLLCANYSVLNEHRIIPEFRKNN